MTITVLPGYMAVRKRPGMYFGVGQGDPRLPEMVLHWAIRDTLAEIAVNVTLHVVATIESDLVFSIRDDGPGICVEPVRPSRKPWLAETLTTLWCGADNRRGTGLAIAAALCDRVVVETLRDGHRYAIEMTADHTAGPLIDAGTTTEHGTHVRFWLDRAYLPDDASLPVTTSRMAEALLAESGRPEVLLTIADQREGMTAV